MITQKPKRIRLPDGKWVLCRPLKKGEQVKPDDITAYLGKFNHYVNHSIGLRMAVDDGNIYRPIKKPAPAKPKVQRGIKAVRAWAQVIGGAIILTSICGLKRQVVSAMPKCFSRREREKDAIPVKIVPLKGRGK